MSKGPDRPDKPNIHGGDIDHPVISGGSIDKSVKPDKQNPDKPAIDVAKRFYPPEQLIPLGIQDVEAHRGVDSLHPFTVFGISAGQRDYFGPKGPIAGIDATTFHRFLQDSPGRTDYTIIDLRNIAEDYANTPNPLEWYEIRGAQHFPVSVNAAAEGRPYYTDFNQLIKGAENKSQVLWDGLRADNTSPFAAITPDIRFVFFHCAQSANRTPYVASGFYEYVTSRMNNPPQIVIIEKGFDEFISEWRVPDSQVVPWSGPRP